MTYRILENKFAVDLSSVRGGGMGKVYRAAVLQSGKPCAIKVIDPANAGSQLHQLALQREIDSLSKLNHTHIVPIVDFGDDTELGRYIALDWLEKDLDHVCRDKPFPDWATYWERIGDPILGALCYAFTTNCLHRDLKPGNVMFDANDMPKLIDFGISGMVDRLGIGPTLKLLRSGVYAPPEDLPRDALRDVYGFAAMSVYCLSGKHPENTQALIACLGQLQIPPTIKRVIENCLATDPDDRPENVIALRECIRRANPPPSPGEHSHSAPTIVLRFGASAMGNMRRLELLNSTEVLDQLNSACFIEENQHGTPKKFMLLSAGYTLIVAVDANNPSALFVLAVLETYADSWSFAQERSFKVPCRFRDASGVGRVVASEQAIQEMFLALTLHRADQLNRSGSSVFQVWRTILRGRAEYYGQKYPTLRITSTRIEGSRIHVKLDAPVDPHVVGLSYFVEDGIERVAAGDVESVTGDRLILYATTEFNLERVVVSGRLRYNAQGTEKAIRNQEIALDRVESNESPNPKLAQLLNDPGLVDEPAALPYKPILPEIDLDKQKAVTSAMGSNSLFLVVGPPGTGKTEFITELVLQEVARNPSARVLLSAQTHMAVDNALQRIRSISPDLSCVRLGKDTDRIALSSHPLMLDSVAKDWRRKVNERCDAALLKFAEDRGVDISRLRARRAAKGVISARTALKAAQERVEQLSSEIANLRSQTVAGVPAPPQIDQLEQELLTAREVMHSCQTSFEEAETALGSCGQIGQDVLDNLASSSTLTEVGGVDVVLDIQVKWMQRLSNARDFFPAVLAEAQVVAGTCLGFLGAPGTADMTFDMAIIEEASRALPTEVLVPASRAKRIVLVGDGKQLPPFLESELLGTEWLRANALTRAEVEETLFARLEAHLPANAVAKLQMQYRMHKDIGQLIGHLFYPGLLESAEGAGSKAVTLKQLEFSNNVLLISTSNEMDRSETPKDTGFLNLCEARLAAKLTSTILMRARKKRCAKFQVVLLTPYVAQRDVLENAIAGLHSLNVNAEVMVHTVHTFQGRQADIAIYCCTRSNTEEQLGFTDDPRLVNVGWSRGRGGLIVIGDTRNLSKPTLGVVYRDLVSYVKSHPESCSFMEAKRAV